MKTKQQFEHLGVSDAVYGRDGVRFATVYSASLRGRGDLSIWAPPQIGNQRDLPIVILLHGVYGSHWCWFHLGGAHFTASRMIAAGEMPPVVIVCPSDGLLRGSSGYLPLPEGDFEGWIGEVPGIVQAVVPACTSASPLLLAGLSMGGYGALRLGFKYPHRYTAISAHSAITDPSQFAEFLEPDDADHLRNASTDNRSLAAWIEPHRDKLPPLRFDCGRDDSLFSHNAALHRALTEQRIHHCFEALDGGHDWLYWSRNIRRSYAFFAQVLAQHSNNAAVPAEFGAL